MSPFKERVFQLSHTIHSLSFGVPYPGMQNPLDGVEVVQRGYNNPLGKHGAYQYYLKVRVFWGGVGGVLLWGCLGDGGGLWGGGLSDVVMIGGRERGGGGGGCNNTRVFTHTSHICIFTDVFTNPHHTHVPTHTHICFVMHPPPTHYTHISSPTHPLHRWYQQHSQTHATAAWLPISTVSLNTSSLLMP